MLKLKVVLAYFCLIFSLIVFLVYFLSKSFVSENTSNVLFYSSAIILGFSIILFKILLNSNKNTLVYKTKRVPFNRVIEINCEDLRINSNSIHQDIENKDYEDFDFERADTLFSGIRRKKAKIENNVVVNSIVYKPKEGREKYFSENINMDSKTLEIKLYIQKNIKLYINDNNGNYYFDLDFLNN